VVLVTRSRNPFRERNNATKAAEVLENAIDRIARRYGVVFGISDDNDARLQALDTSGFVSAYVQLDAQNQPDETDGRTVGTLIDDKIAEYEHRLKRLEEFSGIDELSENDSGLSLYRRIGYIEDRDRNE
jgi:hypothetical protein